MDEYARYHEVWTGQTIEAGNFIASIDNEQVNAYEDNREKSQENDWISQSEISRIVSRD